MFTVIPIFQCTIISFLCIFLQAQGDSQSCLSNSKWLLNSCIKLFHHWSDDIKALTVLEMEIDRYEFYISKLVYQMR